MLKTHLWLLCVIQVLGMKRPKPFSVDNSPGPLFPFQVPPMIDPRMAGENQSSSSDNRSAFVLYPSNTISRLVHLIFTRLSFELVAINCWFKFLLTLFSEIQDGMALWISTQRSALQTMERLIIICTHLAAL